MVQASMQAGSQANNLTLAQPVAIPNDVVDSNTQLRSFGDTPAAADPVTSRSDQNYTDYQDDPYAQDWGFQDDDVPAKDPYRNEYSEPADYNEFGNNDTYSNYSDGNNYSNQNYDNNYNQNNDNFDGFSESDAAYNNTTYQQKSRPQFNANNNFNRGGRRNNRVRGNRPRARRGRFWT